MTDNYKLHIPREHYNEIIDHAKDAYPHEGCGAVVGELREDGSKRVLEICSMKNINTERARDRYEVDPLEFLKIAKEASLSGLEVIGFYHTHPDHPENPSDFDREMAWPVYSYLIISVMDGDKVALKSWILKDEQGDFIEEKIEIRS